MGDNVIMYTRDPVTNEIKNILYKDGLLVGPLRKVVKEYDKVQSYIMWINSISNKNRTSYLKEELQ